MGVPRDGSPPAGSAAPHSICEPPASRPSKIHQQGERDTPSRRCQNLSFRPLWPASQTPKTTQKDPPAGESDAVSRCQPRGFDAPPHNVQLRSAAIAAGRWSAVKRSEDGGGGRTWCGKMVEGGQVQAGRKVVGRWWKVAAARRESWLCWECLPVGYDRSGANDCMPAPQLHTTPSPAQTHKKRTSPRSTHDARCFCAVKPSSGSQ
jgi:hypothetical protein